MKFGVVVFPGSNCDHDAYYALGQVLHQPVEFLWHQSEQVSGFDAIILPGGFSYGDYLRTGAIARFSPVMRTLEKFARAGGLVLGICNGFQILCEAGLLPGVLQRNAGLRFVCRQVHIRVETVDTPFTAAAKLGQVLQIPIAHGEGNYFCDAATLSELERNHQIVFRYTTPDGREDATANPNGSLANIAGICNRERNVLGLMPHPERAVEAALGSDDGLVIFRSLIESLVAKKNSSPQYNVCVNEIFQLQDEAAKHNLRESHLLREAYEVFDEAVRFCNIVLQEMTFEAAKQTAIRRLSVDCLSHALVAMRVGLWGDLPESLVTLRGATESAAQLAFVVGEQKYLTVAAEMNRKLSQVSYDSAIEALGTLGEGMDSFHGRVSEVAAHSTARRLSLVDYKFEGQEYDRLGFAPSPQHAELSAYYCMLACMLVCDALYKAYQQDGIEFRLSQELLGLLHHFDAVSNKFYEKIPKLKQKPGVQESQSSIDDVESARGAH